MKNILSILLLFLIEKGIWEIVSKILGSNWKFQNIQFSKFFFPENSSPCASNLRKLASSHFFLHKFANAWLYLRVGQMIIKPVSKGVDKMADDIAAQLSANKCE